MRPQDFTRLPQITIAIILIGVLTRNEVLAIEENLEERGISEVVVDAKWGSAPGECGYDTGSGRPPDMGCSPISFTVDEEGYIYILDVCNRRINRYDSNGVYVDLISVKYMGLDFTVSNKKVIYLVDAQERIWAYDKKTGELLWKRRFMKEWVELRKEMRSKTGSGWLSDPYLSTDEIGRILFYFGSSLFYITCEFPDSGCKLDIVYGRLGSSGIQQSWAAITELWVMEGPKDIFLKRIQKDIGIVRERKEAIIEKDTVEIVLQNKLLSKEINFKVPNGKGIGFIGMDKDGNSYLIGKQENHQVIFKYNKSGKLLGISPPIYRICEMPSPSFFEMTREFVLDLEGNIYQAITLRESFKIIRIRFLK